MFKEVFRQKRTGAWIYRLIQCHWYSPIMIELRKGMLLLKICLQPCRNKHILGKVLQEAILLSRLVTVSKSWIEWGSDYSNFLERKFRLKNRYQKNHLCSPLLVCCSRSTFDFGQYRTSEGFKERLSFLVDSLFSFSSHQYWNTVRWKTCWSTKGEAYLFWWKSSKWFYL